MKQKQKRRKTYFNATIRGSCRYSLIRTNRLRWATASLVAETRGDEGFSLAGVMLGLFFFGLRDLGTLEGEGFSLQGKKEERIRFDSNETIILT